MTSSPLTLPDFTLLFISSAARENTGLGYTGGMANGRVWKLLNPLSKAAYVMAYREAVRSLAPGREIPRGETHGCELNNGQIAERLDRFFDDPQNFAVRVGEAIGRVIHPMED